MLNHVELKVNHEHRLPLSDDFKIEISVPQIVGRYFKISALPALHTSESGTFVKIHMRG